MPWEPPRFWQAAPGASWLAKTLSPLGAVYHAEVQRRLRKTVPYRADVPVICVGNATMGGVGKTPFVRMLANELMMRGHNPHILTRGYGGREKGPCRVTEHHSADQVGDEPLMLARDVPVWVSRDRAAGAKAAAQDGAGLIIMDDGLQNPSLTKTRALMLVDAESGFGNGEVFPAGPLRERPETARSRADAILAIVAHEGADIPPFLKAFAQDLPLAAAWFSLEGAIPQGPLLAFCGIGRPERFRASLDAEGADLVGFEAFPDHHAFKEKELEHLRDAAQKLSARLVTTEKDYVRIPPQDRDGITPICGAMTWRDGEAIIRLLEERL
ncbi:MAG: tetraacyldisaccharide 4'-kinase [Pseudomonadota bacterium]